jgi:hypothetical protein
VLKSFPVFFVVPVAHGIAASARELALYIMNHTRNTNCLMPWFLRVVEHGMDYVRVKQFFFLCLCSISVVSKWVCSAIEHMHGITLRVLALLRFFQ